MAENQQKAQDVFVSEKEMVEVIHTLSSLHEQMLNLVRFTLHLPIRRAISESLTARLTEVFDSIKALLDECKEIKDKEENYRQWGQYEDEEELSKSCPKHD